MLAGCGAGQAWPVAVLTFFLAFEFNELLQFDVSSCCKRLKVRCMESILSSALPSTACLPCLCCSTTFPAYADHSSLYLGASCRHYYPETSLAYHRWILGC